MSGKIERKGSWWMDRILKKGIKDRLGSIVPIVVVCGQRGSLSHNLTRRGEPLSSEDVRLEMMRTLGTWTWEDEELDCPTTDFYLKYPKGMSLGTNFPATRG
jgi:hypothetical protein